VWPDRVVCGDLRRQRDTAVPCAAAAGVEVEIDSRWNEYEDRDILTHHGTIPAGLERHAGDASLTSREFQEILNEALRGWVMAGASSACSERWPEFIDRATAALGDVASGLERGQTAIVVSSGGVIAALSASLLALAPEALIAFNHVSINTGISKITIGRGGMTLISTNEHAHLEEAGGALISYR
jgi:broad specificity phosphatase PhoE